MVLRPQPTQLFKTIEGTFARDPIPPGQLLALNAMGTHVFSICDAGGTNADLHASAALFSTEGQVFSSIRIDGLINCGSISGDGSVVIAGSDKGRLHMWNGETGKRLTEFGESEGLNSLCDVKIQTTGYSAVSTCFRDDSLRMWDINQGQLTQTFGAVFEKRSRSRLCKLTSDGRRVFACEPRGVHILDQRTGQKAFSLDQAARVLGGLGNFVGAMDVDGDGKVVATVNWPRNTLCLWDVRMQRVKDTVRLRGNHGTGTIAMSANGTRAVCSVFPPDERDRMAVVVDVRAAKVSHRLLHGDSRTVASGIDSKGDNIATLSRDGVVRFFAMTS